MKKKFFGTILLCFIYLTITCFLMEDYSNFAENLGGGRKEERQDVAVSSSYHPFPREQDLNAGKKW